MDSVTEAAKKYVEQLKVVEGLKGRYFIGKRNTKTISYERDHLARLRADLIRAVEEAK